jgi:hypothetical protein
MKYYWVYWKSGEVRTPIRDLHSSGKDKYTYLEVKKTDLWSKQQAVEVMNMIKANYPDQEFEVDLMGQASYLVK